MAARERHDEFDVLRAAATLAVVFIHAAAATAASSDGVRFANEVLHAAVPAFFFLSGALVWPRVPTRRGDRRRRVAKVAVPYVLWSLVYVWLRVERFGDSPLPGGPTLALAASREILVGGVWYHLYFVPVLLLVYALGPVVRRIARRGAWVPLAVTLGLAAVLGSPGPVRLPAVLPPDVADLITDVVRFAPYAAAGFWYVSDRDTALRILRRAWPLLAVVGLGWFALQSFVGVPGIPVMRVPTVLGTLAVILALLGAMSRIPRVGPATAAISSVSFIVYLSHPAVLAVLHRSMLDNGTAAAWERPSMIPVKFAMSLGVAVSGALVYRRMKSTLPRRRREESPVPG